MASKTRKMHAADSPMTDRTEAKPEAEKSVLTVIQPTKEDPTSALTISVIILAATATVSILYVGADLTLPLAMALVLKLLFQPIMQLLCTQLRLPQVVGAFLVIVTLFAAVSALAFAVSGPASVWVQKAPEVLPALKQKLTVLRKPLDYLQKSFNEVKEVASPSDGAEVPTLTVKQASPIGSNFAFATARILERFLATLIFLFFLLASGDRLLRSFIEVLPRFADKRLALEIATEIQRQIGGYLFTITVMNALVGVVTGLTMWACGLGDPILWGGGCFRSQLCTNPRPSAGRRDSGCRWHPRP
jgi:predicted PurR-regulated permease PerM